MESERSFGKPARTGALKEVSRNAIQELLRKKAEMEMRKIKPVVKPPVDFEDLTDDIEVENMQSFVIEKSEPRKRLVKKSQASRPRKNGEGVDDLTHLLGSLSLQKPERRENTSKSTWRQQDDSPNRSDSFHSAHSQSDTEEDGSESHCAQKLKFPAEEETNVSHGVNIRIRDTGRSVVGGRKGGVCQQGEPSGSGSRGEVEGSSPADEKYILDGGKFQLPGRMVKGLYPHQKQGIEWMWKLHKAKQGGILGDDMGLGKTRQVSTFLAGLFLCRRVRRVLLVLPATLLAQWRQELGEVGLKKYTYDYTSSMTLTQRYAALQTCLQGEGILLTTYEMATGHVEELQGGAQNLDEGVQPWDYLILDEAHRVKNPQTKGHKALKAVGGPHVLLLTGTPVQNHLKELWALFDLCCPDLLGDRKEFKYMYEKPIEEGSDRKATHRAMAAGNKAAQLLRDKISPHFLRRTKAEIFSAPPETSSVSGSGLGELPASGAAEAKSAESSVKLPSKTDLIVWLTLSARQQRLYRAFLHSERVKEVLNETKSALAALTVLKKICDHPSLLNESAVEEIAESEQGLGLGALNPELVRGFTRSMEASVELEAEGGGGREDVASCKIEFASRLVEDLVKNGHRVLIFAQTRMMLDMMQAEVERYGIRYNRIDGTMPLQAREKCVQEFQGGPEVSVFLLTTQVGGLGLTLTGADRVVIMDPSWNPSVDNQSVDRAYRMGQKRAVVVYRLVSCGTIEEKVYRKQVYKGGLMKTATETKRQLRYFSHQELSDLFTEPQGGFMVSETCRQLAGDHAGDIATSAQLSSHLGQLVALNPGVLFGFSRHDLLFSKEAPSLPVLGPEPRQLAMPPSAFIRRPRGYGPPHASASAPASWQSANSGFGGCDLLSEAERGLAGLALNPAAEGPREQLLREAERRRSQVWEQLQRCRAVRRNPNMVLRDGGVKLEARMAALEEELQRAEEALART